MSYSTKDALIVKSVYTGLKPGAAWLDKAEIEWGDRFLESIAKAIDTCSDFVLFWSTSAAASEWVRLELNMAFIRMMTEKAIRLRVVVLDKTPLPLYLRPYQFLDASQSKDQSKFVLQPLREVLEQSQRGVRHQFIDRSEELKRLESAIDDEQVHTIALVGFQGIGKRSLVNEAYRRFFEGAKVVTINVTNGTGLIELALYLNQVIGKSMFKDGSGVEEAKRIIRLAVEEIAQSGRFLAVCDVQYWLDEDSVPREPLVTLLSSVAMMPSMRKRPMMVTSTRRIKGDVELAKGTTVVTVGGLGDDYLTSLLQMWHELCCGKELAHDKAVPIARQLRGHPIAAKVASGLIGQFGSDYLQKYPRELVSLRRDVAAMLLNDIPLSQDSLFLMESLAMINAPLPATVVAKGTGLSDEQFQHAITQCSGAGLIDHSGGLTLHPLFVDYFWRAGLHRKDYQSRAELLGRETWDHTRKLDVQSADFVALLPIAFRLFALAGRIEEATRIRRDLSGELAQAAILHYNRRNYEVASQYMDLVLEQDPSNWQMRVYKIRVQIRREEWLKADAALKTMVLERPGDIGVMHLIGWRYLRAKDYKTALDYFVKVIAKREHVLSLRDGAECLHQLDRSPEALSFLSRAKKVESENPFVLDLEAKILEKLERYDEAFDAAWLASIRDPGNWSFQHRLGRIRMSQNRASEAVPYFARAVDLDSEQFTPLSSLIDALLDVGKTDGVN
ncbi:MAG: TIR domain-containing protein, partial [Patescibacteria group bacterium]